MLNDSVHSEHNERTLRRLRRRQRQAGRLHDYRGGTIAPSMFNSTRSVA